MTDEYLNIILENEGLIYYIAKKFYNLDQNDLYQAGCLGLIKAYKRYNPCSNVKFSTYAYKDIFGEMYNLYQTEGMIKLNKTYLSLYKKIEIYKCEFFKQCGFYPTTDEIAKHLNVDASFVNEIIIMGENILSLDDESKELQLYDVIPDKIYDISNDILMRDSLENLNTREKDIIKLRYFEDYSQQETANKLGITQVMVSRYEKSGKAKIKEYINA